MNPRKLTQVIVFYFKFFQLENMAPFLHMLHMILPLLVNILTERTVKLDVGGFKTSISKIFTNFYFILLLSVVHHTE
jgi:hypothetical protein